MPKICFKCYKEILEEYETVEKKCDYCNYSICTYTHKDCQVSSHDYDCPKKIRKFNLTVNCNICHKDTIHQDNKIRFEKCCSVGKSYDGYICCECKINKIKNKKKTVHCLYCEKDFCEDHKSLLYTQHLIYNRSCYLRNFN